MVIRVGSSPILHTKNRAFSLKKARKMLFFYTFEGLKTYFLANFWRTFGELFTTRRVFTLVQKHTETKNRDYSRFFILIVK